MDEDIRISPEEKEILINKLKSRKFEEFKVHRHYYDDRDKSKPRHGITLDHSKNIFEQFDKILEVYKRRKLIGFTYTFIYKLGKKQSYYLIFLLDKDPYELFDAYFFGKTIEKRLFKKFFGFKLKY
jgi:hypothetical protein